jgi:hypothetical protein
MRVPHRIILPLFLLILLSASGCDDAINPNAPYEPRIVVYAILNTGTNRQFVRTYVTADPSASSSATAEPVVSDATVTISQLNTVYQLRDTTLERSDTSRYSSGVAAKVASPFTPQYGNEYVLRVQSPTTGTYVARTKVPKRGDISSAFIYILQTPGDYKYDLRLDVKVYGKGYVLRMLLQYEVEINGIWFEETEEVPRSMVTSTQVLFPVVVQAVGQGEKLKWPLETLSYTFAAVKKRFEMNHITFKRVTLQLRQYDENLFNYYQIVNSFHDPRSIRVDLPDYTNIPNGLGVFGACTVEELVYELPPDFIKNQ